ncbi:bidirectional sugar transporter SWEET4-like [Nymphaea colorata]|nr:bidirectional sugar transporter SWEET4-like [Nymphaea colorata]
MVSADTARTVVGIIGNVISFGLFLSPLPTFVQICKKGAVEQFSPLPYLATLLNCMLWILYGLPIVHPHSLLVITINGCGFAIELVYLMLFLIYSDRKQRLKIAVYLVLEFAFVAAVSAAVILLAHTHDRRSLIVGSLCVFFCCMMYAAPMSVMKLVIRTKSVEYMPFFLSLASFANGICWTAYALIRFDLFITIPNGIGTVLGLMQLALYATYYKSTKKILEERKKVTKGGDQVYLAEVVVSKEPAKSGNAIYDANGAMK